jgi:cell fate (sporulation/competence/biofilm development) regulator YmcA (YheA/YmcA/DUF963 family)
MPERLRDIKDTASDAVEIVRELGSPEVQQSLEKIRDTANIAKQIMESLKDPAMVRNLENVRLMAESLENSGSKIEALTNQLKTSGVLEEARETMKSARGALDSVGSGKNMGETMDAIKDMVRSISELVQELKLTVVASKKDGIIHNAEEAVRETRSIITQERE